MTEHESEIAFLRSQVVALDELLEHTPEDHFLMYEPLKARKHELVTRLTSLMKADVAAQPHEQEHVLLRTYGELSQAEAPPSAVKLREAQIQLELARLHRIKRHEQLERIEDYIGFLVFKLLGLVTLLLGGMESLDAAVTPLNIRNPEFVFAIGFVLVITPKIFQAWGAGALDRLSGGRDAALESDLQSSASPNKGLPPTPGSVRSAPASRRG